LKPQKTLQEQLPELREGQSIVLLQELHILTREGKLNQDTRRKLKQFTTWCNSSSRCWPRC
jgi:hypothetical protein